MIFNKENYFEIGQDVDYNLVFIDPLGEGRKDLVGVFYEVFTFEQLTKKILIPLSYAFKLGIGEYGATFNLEPDLFKINKRYFVRFTGTDPYQPNCIQTKDYSVTVLDSKLAGPKLNTTRTSFVEFIDPITCQSISLETVTVEIYHIQHKKRIIVCSGNLDNCSQDQQLFEVWPGAYVFYCFLDRNKFFQCERYFSRIYGNHPVDFTLQEYIDDFMIVEPNIQSSTIIASFI